MTDAASEDGATKPALPRRRTTLQGPDPLTLKDAGWVWRPPTELLQRVKDGLLDSAT